MIDPKFTNEATMQEKKEIIKNASTMVDHAKANEATERGGRYAKQQETTFTGELPKMPDGNPWARDPVPKEEPLNYDINTVEPCGTAAEIEASLQKEKPE